MELLLNLAWLLLGLPAYWLWRRGAGARLARRFSALQGMLALGCALVLLFPVISASDDLHAMRAEMEDSSISKRTVRQAGSDKNSAWVNRLQGLPAAVARAALLAAPEVGWLDVSVLRVSPLAGPCDFHGGRAPPVCLLG
ncbi:MAG TPA: hypothetical protein VNX26_00855 [Candidatus Acidoferrum sp.]|jgi:hypothetical protein|nr:hypothetical protein [Candidatus Acidoferrum sp.]